MGFCLLFDGRQQRLRRPSNNGCHGRQTTCMTAVVRRALQCNCSSVK
ncbi:MAG: hypothetical protein HXL34_08180 [Prevotellaceae bacterium]|nr:hypothetical protein [Prevotellaceae bacterium]